MYLSDELSVSQVTEEMVTAGKDVAVMKGPQDDITGILTDQEVARCSRRANTTARSARPFDWLGLFFIQNLVYN